MTENNLFVTFKLWFDRQSEGIQVAIAFASILLILVGNAIFVAGIQALWNILPFFDLGYLETWVIWIVFWYIVRKLREVSNERE